MNLADEIAILEDLVKSHGGPFIGPRGGKWADAQHTVAWTADGGGKPAGEQHDASAAQQHAAIREIKMLDEQVDVAVDRYHERAAESSSLKKTIGGKWYGYTKPDWSAIERTQHARSQLVSLDNKLFDHIKRAKKATADGLGGWDQVGAAAKLSATKISAILDGSDLAKSQGGPFIGPRGGKWADAQHTVAWTADGGGKAAAPKPAAKPAPKPTDDDGGGKTDLHAAHEVFKAAAKKHEKLSGTTIREEFGKGEHLASKERLIKAGRDLEKAAEADGHSSKNVYFLRKLVDDIRNQGTWGPLMATIDSDIADMHANKPSAHTIDVVPISTVKDKQVGGQTGSNPGGTYIGRYGVKRYVKDYASPTQAHGEAVANNVYRALGIAAPKPTLAVRRWNDGVSFASDYLPGSPTVFSDLSSADKTKYAKQVLDGYAADVLVANWDTVGLTLDNLVVSDGVVHRIDNGGALLKRAQGADKPGFAMTEIREMDGLMDPHINPSYAKVARLAGVSKPSDIPGIHDQIAAIGKLVDGGIDHMVPSVDGVPESDRQKTITMIQNRAALLKKWSKDNSTMPTNIAKSRGGPFVGPRGGKWADAQHTVAWTDGGGDKPAGGAAGGKAPSHIVDSEAATAAIGEARAEHAPKSDYAAKVASHAASAHRSLVAGDLPGAHAAVDAAQKHLQNLSGSLFHAQARSSLAEIRLATRKAEASNPRDASDDGEPSDAGRKAVLKDAATVAAVAGAKPQADSAANTPRRKALDLAYTALVDALHDDYDVGSAVDGVEKAYKALSPNVDLSSDIEVAATKAVAAGRAYVREKTKQSGVAKSLTAQEDSMNIADQIAHLEDLAKSTKENGWKTIRGTHVHFGQDGDIDKGPAAVKAAVNDKGGKAPASDSASFTPAQKKALKAVGQIKAAAVEAAKPAAKPAAASGKSDGDIAAGKKMADAETASRAHFEQHTSSGKLTGNAADKAGDAIDAMRAAAKAHGHADTQEKHAAAAGEFNAAKAAYDKHTAKPAAASAPATPKAAKPAPDYADAGSAAYTHHSIGEMTVLDDYKDTGTSPQSAAGKLAYHAAKTASHVATMRDKVAGVDEPPDGHRIASQLHEIANQANNSHDRAFSAPTDADPATRVAKYKEMASKSLDIIAKVAGDYAEHAAPHTAKPAAATAAASSAPALYPPKLSSASYLAAEAQIDKMVESPNKHILNAHGFIDDGLASLGKVAKEDRATVKQHIVDAAHHIDSQDLSLAAESLAKAAEYASDGRVDGLAGDFTDNLYKASDILSMGARKTMKKSMSAVIDELERLAKGVKADDDGDVDPPDEDEDEGEEPDEDEDDDDDEPVDHSEDVTKSHGGPFVGPRGGKWADAQHTVAWTEGGGDKPAGGGGGGGGKTSLHAAHEEFAAAAKDHDTVSKYTAFSQYGKGEHGASKKALAKAGRGLVKAAKADGHSSEHVTALRDMVDDINDHGSGPSAIAEVGSHVDKMHAGKPAGGSAKHTAASIAAMPHGAGVDFGDDEFYHDKPSGKWHSTNNSPSLSHAEVANAITEQNQHGDGKAEFLKPHGSVFDGVKKSLTYDRDMVVGGLASAVTALRQIDGSAPSETGRWRLAADATEVASAMLVGGNVAGVQTVVHAAIGNLVKSIGASTSLRTARAATDVAINLAIAERMLAAKTGVDVSAAGDDRLHGYIAERADAAVGDFADRMAKSQTADPVPDRVDFDHRASQFDVLRHAEARGTISPVDLALARASMAERPDAAVLAWARQHG